jgi:hypothetical protein
LHGDQKINFAKNPGLPLSVWLATLPALLWRLLSASAAAALFLLLAAAPSDGGVPDDASHIDRPFPPSLSK